jgi:hypothetical protein
MMEKMKDVYQPGKMLGKLSDQQIAQQSTWTVIPENERVVASMHVIRVVPSNASTETTVNPTDPGDGCHYEIPGAKGSVVPAGRIRG